MRTPPETLHLARKIARETGLHYVYEGNIHAGAGETLCPNCNEVLIRRSWHSILQNKLRNGRCPKCSTEIPGRWTSPAGGATNAKLKASSRLGDKYETLNL